MDKKCNQNLQLHADHGKVGPSHSRANVNVPTIFLSHSGRQKPFVENLFDALKNANHEPFFDKHSLPKGSPFPKYIEEAALGCRLGVVVLSEDFLTSKWPMQELKMLVLQRGSDAKVLPVCYKLNFEDLKSPTNLSRWRSVWNEKYSEHADQWEKAVQTLARLNGEVYVPETSESAYITRVVHHICTLVPCPARYDMSSIQGHQRLAEEIASIFKRVKARCPEESTCMVGLYGVGGLGKTTLCGSMVNYYTSQYVGRSYLIEFPSDGDKSKIVQACKGALKKLANLSKELLLDDINSFEQVIPLMSHVKRYNVFLAIDNVWDNSLEEARRLLRVGFSATSKILLTSRSEQVLKDLLMEHSNNKYCVGPLPTPEHEEAVQLFQEGFEDVGNRRSLLDRDQIDILLERCRFGGNYHPLALKALAHHVKRVCTFEDLENWKHRLSVVLEEISNAHLPTVENVIRLSYDSLRSIKKKHMFLDIAICLEPRVDAKRSLDGEKYSTIHTSMCYIYKELTETQITTLIGDLALDGLIQIEAGKDGTEKRVRVHDLYLDLAHKEAASSSRYLVTGSTSSGEEIIEWERLERVHLRNTHTRLFEKVQNKKCEKLLVVMAGGVTIRSEMHLDCMPSLRILWLVCISEEQRTSRNRMGRAAAPGRVYQAGCLSPATRTVGLQL